MSRFKLSSAADQLSLVDRFNPQKPLTIDFLDPGFKRRLLSAGRKSELVAKAVGVKPGLKVLDCTAGLGRDALILAQLGCFVTCIERSRVLWMLLRDGLNRAKGSKDLQTAANKITIHHGDSCTYLKEINPVDVIYLDPMYPAKTSSALVKGEMQFLQRYFSTDVGGAPVESLLQLAIASPCQKVVLKRPPHVSSNSEPHHVVENRSARFEVYLGAAAS